MKTYRSFLKGISIIYLSCFISFFTCSSEVDVDVQSAEMPPPLTDVLTLELAFGADEVNLKEEFLLVRPAGFTVNDNGDFFVADEAYIKVYNKNGESKAIFGGTGQGPGEFSTTMLPYAPSVSQDGYLSVIRDLDGYNLYTPDKKFIKNICVMTDNNLRWFKSEIGCHLFHFRDITTLSETEQIIQYDIWKDVPDNINKIVGDGLIYYHSGKIFEIAHYAPEFSNDLQEMGSTGIRSIYQLPFQTNIKWDVLPGKRIIYMNPAFDISEHNGVYQYVLHIIDLETFERNQIIREYTPVEVKESLRTGKYTENNENQIKNIAEKLKYFYPVHLLMTDNDVIFIFPTTFYMSGFKKNIKVEYLVEILYAETWEIINTAYLPFIPEIIKNGYVYRQNINEEGFSIIEKYKIDPAVYGK